MSGRTQVQDVRYVLAMVCGAVLISGCGAAEHEKSTTLAASRNEPVPVSVVSEAAAERPVPTIVRATGTFVADESSDVAPQVSGQIIATPVNVGDIVKAGQVVMRLEDRDARTKLKQAEASLQQADAQALRASAEAKRNAELVERGLISPSSFELLSTQVAVAEAAVAQAAAQIASAEKAVEDTTIRAPFAGHVSARSVAVGEFATTASKLVTIVRITPIKLQLLVPESGAAKLRRGMAVLAEVPAYPGTTFTGAVSALNVAIDPASRAMTIEATFPNADARLTPGMFGSAEVRLPATERALFIPQSALVSIANGESFGVFVVDGDIVRIRVVQPGERQGGVVRILSGLDAGAVVATTKVAQLFEGARVQAAQATTQSDPANTRVPQKE
ncbi:MAG: efflux RND transporter periplasmic adaptor subunit [Vicinamibacterales bacterium]